MTVYFDDLETRSEDARAADQLARLKLVVALVQDHVGSCFPGGPVNDISDLTRFPVLRKDTLHDWQRAQPPFGGVAMGDFTHVFQSPGPIYEPGGSTHDWWRFGRFLHACGIGKNDIVQNCFGYHLTPAGTMFENGARAVGAKVLPAGTGQTELQVRAAADVGSTAYAGTPDYLKVILEKADEMKTGCANTTQIAV